MAPYPLRTEQSISNAILPYISFTQGILHEAAALHLEHMTCRRNPEPSISVFRYTVYLFVQRVRHLSRHPDVVRTEKGETFSSADPQHSARIQQQAVHILRNKTIANAIVAPSAF